MNHTFTYELETRTSSLFGTLRTLCLTDGTKAACGAMLHLARTIYPSTWAGQPEHPHRYTILAARNVSTDFLAACAMLDMDVAWLYPEDTSLDHGTALNVTPEAVYDALEQSMADAFYMAVPDFLGNSCDLFGISEACHARDIPLLVDNSAGSYLYFLDDGRHPMQLGVDMCFDDASHLLPGLTGAAWLHIAPCAADLYAARLQAGEAGLSYSQVQQRLIANARVSAALYSSVHPSDEVLSSMDACVRRLRGDGDLPQAIAAAIARLDKLKEHLRKIDVNVPESDPLRIVIDARSLGETGASLRDLYVLASGPNPDAAIASNPTAASDTAADNADMTAESAGSDHTISIGGSDTAASSDSGASSNSIAASSDSGAASTEAPGASNIVTASAGTPCVPAAYADNRYLIFLVEPGTPEQEISQIFRAASRIKHAKQTGKAVNWYLLTGNPEPERPDNADEENLDDFTDISELEAFEAKNDDKPTDEFDLSEAGAEAGGAGADGSNGEYIGAETDGESSGVGGGVAGSRTEVIIEDVAAELAFPAPDMCDPGQFTLRQPEKVCPVRDAMLAEHTRIAIDEAIGKVCAMPVSCHPAWTIIAPGERIDENTIAIMKSYGIGYAEISSPAL